MEEEAGSEPFTSVVARHYVGEGRELELGSEPEMLESPEGPYQGGKGCRARTAWFLTFQ